MYMDKYRKVFYEIEKALKNDAYGVIILVGLRKTGKTTILKQLANKYDGYYLDFKDSKDPDTDYLNIYERSEKLILLDEIGYLPSFDAYFGNLEKDIKSVGKKVVITSSSYGTLKQLSSEKLGGGRSKVFKLPPITFVEYLYFTDKIPCYEDYSAAKSEHFKDYLQLKGLLASMTLTFDENYFVNYYEMNTESNLNSSSSKTQNDLQKEDLQNLANLLAYQLADTPSYNTIIRPEIGEREPMSTS